MSAIQLEGVQIRHGSRVVLEDVSVAISAGEIVAIIGSNGAGKTTLLDVMSGSPGGRSTSGARVRVGRVFQGSPLPATLTVMEVAQLVANDLTAASRLLDSFGLYSHRSSFVGELSTGMRRILDLACATAGSPEVLLLDEPASGLAEAEVEHLAHLIREWRDSTGGAVVIVEHDLSLVETIADRVIVLERGRISAEGRPDQILAGRELPRRDGEARESAAISDALKDIRSHRAPRQADERAISTWTLLRLGLREFAAGLGSVLILGVLNRVMKVELGISLGVVAAVLACYNLAAPVGLAVGHLSDRRPFRGRHRLPYIVAGAVLTGLTVAAAPHVAGLLGRGVSVSSVSAAVTLFAAMGVGMYSAGSVYFALISDMTTSRERGPAVAIVYIELLAGVLAGVALVQALVEEDTTGLGALFALSGLLIVALTVIAVWGHEDRLKLSRPREISERVPLRTAMRSLAGMRQVRMFFSFMVASTFFLFLHQAVLEPYGGDVLGLSVRGTSAFNAAMTLGMVAGMLVGGRPKAARIGYKNMATVGLIISSVGFAVLALSALASAAPATWIAIVVLGSGTGVFTVAALALMMEMATPARTALFMGVWTMAHALADGAATGGGGVVFEIFARFAYSEPVSYAMVFAIEALGLLACIWLLRPIDTEALGS